MPSRARRSLEWDQQQPTAQMAPTVEAPLPHIEVTDSKGNDVMPSGPSPANSWSSASGHRDASEAAHNPAAAGDRNRSASDAGSHSAVFAKSNGAPPADEERRKDTRTSTTIDPLSQHILKRTQTESATAQRLRLGANDATSREGGSGSGAPSNDVAKSGREPPDKTVAATTTTTTSTGNKEKKRGGVSFLSRIIGTKKKETTHDSGGDNESELGEQRTEGMDAPVFLHPITSNAYTPHHPAPPRYIKVRTHNKRIADFNRVFLAQELRGRKPDAGGATTPRLSAPDGAHPARTPVRSSAIWSLEFSVDGRFLAAGGQDRVVRVWVVIATAEEREAHESEEATTAVDAAGQTMRLHAPVFRTKPVREYEGHTLDVLDLSWSKNNFLLSSSMDKTVRLWHTSRQECLCCFKHSDFVTSIAFHPRDDRFFLAGSLDSKLRLWSIPDKSVAYWNQLPDLITAVAFTPDGKTSIAGCLNGHCLFYETEGLRYASQIHVRSARGKNAKGSKIAGIQTTHLPPHEPEAKIKLLVTSNDSRIRMYNFRDQALEMKFRGNENSCSQIRASFSDEARYVVCGSEDRKVYIWSTGPPGGDKKDRQPVEMFSAHSAIVTATVLAPVTTRQMLGRSGDPIYDLCNPPPVTLVSRTESRASSSRAPTDASKRLSDANPASPPAAAEARAKNATPAEASPLYISRSAHRDGNIVVSADYMGVIKVFRQDCAHSRRRIESWDAPPSSTFPKKLGGGSMLNRNASGATRMSTHRRRASSSSHGPSSDRIISWRNAISSSNTSLDNVYRSSERTRSASPRKFTFSRQAHGSTPLTYANSPSISTSSPPGSIHQASTDTAHAHAHAHAHSRLSSPRRPSQKPPSKKPPHAPAPAPAPAIERGISATSDSNSLMIQADGQSLAFWNMSNWQRSGGRRTQDGSRGGSRDASRGGGTGVNSHKAGVDGRPGAGRAAGRAAPAGSDSARTTSVTSTTSAVSALSALSSEVDDELERKARAAAAAAAAEEEEEEEDDEDEDDDDDDNDDSNDGDHNDDNDDPYHEKAREARAAREARQGRAPHSGPSQPKSTPMTTTPTTTPTMNATTMNATTEQVLRCHTCGSASFKATRIRRGKGKGETQRLVCSICGTPV